MGKAVRKRDTRRRTQKEMTFPPEKTNFMIIGLGLLVILGGYLAMLEGSVEGFLPQVLAPILLVLGYCIIIPVGILYRKSRAAAGEAPPVKEPAPPQS